MKEGGETRLRTGQERIGLEERGIEMRVLAESYVIVVGRVSV